MACQSQSVFRAFGTLLVSQAPSDNGVWRWPPHSSNQIWIAKDRSTERGRGRRQGVWAGVSSKLFNIHVGMNGQIVRRRGKGFFFHLHILCCFVFFCQPAQFVYISKSTNTAVHHLKAFSCEKLNFHFLRHFKCTCLISFKAYHPFPSSYNVYDNRKTTAANSTNPYSLTHSLWSVSAKTVFESNRINGSQSELWLFTYVLKEH